MVYDDEELPPRCPGARERERERRKAGERTEREKERKRVNGARRVRARMRGYVCANG